MKVLKKIVPLPHIKFPCDFNYFEFSLFAMNCIKYLPVFFILPNPPQTIKKEFYAKKTFIFYFQPVLDYLSIQHLRSSSCGAFCGLANTSFRIFEITLHHAEPLIGHGNFYSTFFARLHFYLTPVSLVPTRFLCSQ